VRRGLQKLFSSLSDWKVCGEAVDGVEATEKAKVLRPSVVLMDISMPGMDGLEAARVIRREVPESKVIIISQNDPEIARSQAREVDVAAFVAKSELAAGLVATLNQVFGIKRAETLRTTSDLGSSTPWWLAGGGELGIGGSNSCDKY
jgi:DNA-binding NarL/FixJ family response regulator